VWTITAFGQSVHAQAMPGASSPGSPQQSASPASGGTPNPVPALPATQDALDWDNHYDFSVDEYVQRLQAGLEIALDHREKWTFSPYVLFPLNHESRVIETKNAVGFDLSYNFQASLHTTEARIIP